MQKSKARKAAIAIFAIIFAVSLALLIYRLVDYKLSASSAQRALELAIHTAPPQTEASSENAVTTDAQITEAVTETTEATTATPETTVNEELLEIPDAESFLYGIDISALQEVNSDVFAWIYIPDGGISYPILQTDNNSWYLNHSWEGKRSTSGSIFMECRSNKDFSDFNTILYGHNIRNYSYFAPLHTYKDPEYKKDHEYVYIVTETEILRYYVFSAYETDTASDTYRIIFEDDGQKLNALNYYVESSVWENEEPLTEQNKILTLSTCTRLGIESKRWVVQAALDAVWQR